MQKSGTKMSFLARDWRSQTLGEIEKKKILNVDELLWIHFSYLWCAHFHTQSATEQHVLQRAASVELIVGHGGREWVVDSSSHLEANKLRFSPLLCSLFLHCQWLLVLSSFMHGWGHSFTCGAPWSTWYELVRVAWAITQAFSSRKAYYCTPTPSDPFQRRIQLCRKSFNTSAAKHGWLLAGMGLWGT